MERKKRIRDLKKRVTLLKKQVADEQPKYSGEGKCVEFNAYIDGDGESRGTKLSGVENVILPYLYNRRGNYCAGAIVRLDFNCLENAAVVLKKSGDRRRLEIRGAVTHLPEEGGYTFHGHRHIMEVSFARLEQTPLEKEKPTAVSVTFDVDSYTVYVENEKLWEVRSYDA